MLELVMNLLMTIARFLCTNTRHYTKSNPQGNCEVKILKTLTLRKTNSKVMTDIANETLATKPTELFDNFLLKNENPYMRYKADSQYASIRKKQE